MTYSEAIEQVMLHNGYIASLQYIYSEIDKYRALTGKTPRNTIQERMQRDGRFTRIGVGLYALTAFLDQIHKEEEPQEETQKQEYHHSMIQGMLLEIGELNQYRTYTHDKSKKFEGKTLGLIASLKDCPDFTYHHIIKHSVRYLDVIWFDNRDFPFPKMIFEVEHSTDFRSALVKFSELQDFVTRFYLVAPEERREKFDTEIHKTAFQPILQRCKFLSYDLIEEQYQGLLEYKGIRNPFT